MKTFRSIAGLFACASLLALGAGCSVGEKQENVGEGEQLMLEACECPSVVGASSNAVDPCECPPDEPPPVDPPGDEQPPVDPPVDEPPGDEGPCPEGQEQVCSVKAPAKGAPASLLPPEECECVPVESCPPGSAMHTVCDGVVMPQGAGSIWAGSSGCVTQCIASM